MSVMIGQDTCQKCGYPLAGGTCDNGCPDPFQESSLTWKPDSVHPIGDIASPVTEDEIREAIGLCSWVNQRSTIRRLAYQRDKLICKNERLLAVLDEVRRLLASII